MESGRLLSAHLTQKLRFFEFFVRINFDVISEDFSNSTLKAQNVVKKGQNDAKTIS